MTSDDQNPPFYQYYKDTIPIELVEWINKIVSEQDLEWQRGAFGGGSTCLLYTSPSPRDIR